MSEEDRLPTPVLPEGTGQLVLYRTEDGRTRINVRLIQESVWLTLNQIADLFQRDKSVISKHIKNVFETGELDPARTVAKFATVQTEGGRSVAREIEFYRLEVILAVGYRVKSARGKQFRQWATAQLEQYLVKGFAMDDERLKQAGGGNYFDELLARIRDIRSSERVFWRKVLDIYATSVDYDPRAEASQKFFAVVQNKMHWAAHGQTAAEVIVRRADSSQPNMGLTTWTGNRPRRTDVGFAKNYLTNEEIETLNLIVSAYLDFAELQARSGKPMTMREWIAKLDSFLTLSDRDLLTHAGTCLPRRCTGQSAIRIRQVPGNRGREASARRSAFRGGHREGQADRRREDEAQAEEGSRTIGALRLLHVSTLVGIASDNA